jgi:hypothetical protein
MKKRFYIFLTMAFAVLMVTYGALNASGVLPLPVVIPVAISCYALLTLLLFKYMSNAWSIHPKRFPTAMMAATAVKMLLTLAFLATYLYIDRSQKVTIAMAVFAIYITYTIVLLVPFTASDKSNSAPEA